MNLLPLGIRAQVIAEAQGKDTTKTSVTVPVDSVERKKYPWRPNFRFRDRYGDPFSNYTTVSPFFLKDPEIIKSTIELDTGLRFNISEMNGARSFRTPSLMNFSEYDRFQDAQMRKDYFKTKSRSLDGESSVSGRGLIPKLYVSPALDRIFGGSYVELVPRGFVTLDFGGSWQKVQNPAIPIRQQRNGGFDFNQQMNLSVQGKIGEKLKVSTNFDNNNSFDFQNQMKIEYTGFKEDILKKLEIGNVGLPLNNSLITGAQNLFGIKAQMQFGKLFMTSIITTQRGKQQSINLGGSTNGTSQGRPFEIQASNYDENRNFFLGQFFRDNFEGWLSTLPQIISGVNITRVEVYLLNRNNDTQTLRDIVGVQDMGESDKIYRKDLFTSSAGNRAPTNNASNNLFQDFLTGIDRNSETISSILNEKGLVSGTDFEKITSARKLAPTEFTVNRQLGYITLQRKLQNDEALAVAFEYTYNGRVYKVGELSEDYADIDDRDVVFLKLLRPRKIAIKDKAGKILPTWNLMMKNAYNLNVSQLTRENFQLRVIYRDDRTGKDNPQLQDGDISRTRQLIQVFGLDRLNPYNDPQPDGNFDFVEGVTINTETGLIVFPFLEPFNSGLRKLFNLENNSNTRDFLLNKYLYDTLYRTTKAEAELVATKNKFFLVGEFKAGSGKEIIIQGFNITQGSVKVYAGGTPLIEGRDYTIDYTFGKVTILNDGVLSSGKDINITYEQQDPFAFQTRSLLGTRLDYKLSEDINIGSTLLYYNERPLITRNLIGTEPARNLQYGLDLNLRKYSRVLTKIVDALPFLETKETSSISLNAEFAQLLPGTSNVVNGDGTSFIDDFENTATPYSLMSPLGWKLSATPKESAFDEAASFGINDVGAGYRRGRLSWYTIDNLWYRELSRFKPDYLSTEVVNLNHYTRAVQQQEIFPGRDRQIGNFYEPILDLAYYPAERGPYNYNTSAAELTPDGYFRNPEKNWAGITSAIRNEVDWDKANVEYIEFWMLNPFIDDPKSLIDDGINPPKANTTGGKLIFHMGSISEDIMRDGKHAFENGLPANGDLTSGETSENEWGYVTTRQYLNNAFDISATSRKNQDVGLDGAGNEQEKIKFADYLNALPPAARQKAETDPSGDDFQ
ncbi:MAG: cell surface protein SprA, partial [Cyclobacteriaceae bacterium]